MEGRIRLVGFGVGFQAERIGEREGRQLLVLESAQVLLGINGGEMIIAPVFGGTGLLYWSEYPWAAHLSAFVRTLHMGRREFDPSVDAVEAWYKIKA